MNIFLFYNKKIIYITDFFINPLSAYQDHNKAIKSTTKLNIIMVFNINQIIFSFLLIKMILLWLTSCSFFNNNNNKVLVTHVKIL